MRGGGWGHVVDDGGRSQFFFEDRRALTANRGGLRERSAVCRATLLGGGKLQRDLQKGEGRRSGGA